VQLGYLEPFTQRKDNFVVLVHNMKTYVGVEAQLYSFLIFPPVPIQNKTGYRGHSVAVYAVWLRMISSFHFYRLIFYPPH
jgi:hypothetical protein